MARVEKVEPANKTTVKVFLKNVADAKLAASTIFFAPFPFSKDLKCASQSRVILPTILDTFGQTSFRIEYCICYDWNWLKYFIFAMKMSLCHIDSREKFSSLLYIKTQATFWIIVKPRLTGILRVEKVPDFNFKYFRNYII